MMLMDFINADAWDGPYEAVECRKALSPSRLPGLNYALNPYGGCTHGCVYCYAPEVTHAEWRTWRVVRVRVNIAERLSRELRGLSGTIGIGTVTDPYQEPERRFELTRSCLDVLQGSGMSVNIMTKSDLVLRDIDLIAGLDHAVGMTLTTTDDSISKRLEPGAPLPGRRIAALKALADAGIRTYILLGPLMSVIEGRERELADAVLSTGARLASIDGLNLRPQLSERLGRMGVGPSRSSVMLVRRYLEEGGLRVEDAF